MTNKEKEWMNFGVQAEVIIEMYYKGSFRHSVIEDDEIQKIRAFNLLLSEFEKRSCEHGK